MKTKNGKQWLKRAGISIGIVFILFTIWSWFIVNHLPSMLKPDESKPIAVLFSNVRVISMVGESSLSQNSQDVLIIGDRITEIDTVGEIKAPEGALVIDGEGYTLMPGLIDAHIHLNDELELATYLAHGVTGVRNMSGGGKN
ncbi:amidohydrolase family protein [Pseudomonas aeruginosa]|uniref:amidohydrolase family protein n=1 Tax=Pseudomonas aeruginosa TaxID=287 RepID=UPI002553BBEB|nr:hypothetical protein [Pseudomonas aeruginosa]